MMSNSHDTHLIHGFLVSIEFAEELRLFRRHELGSSNRFYGRGHYGIFSQTCVPSTVM